MKTEGIENTIAECAPPKSLILAELQDHPSLLPEQQMSPSYQSSLSVISYI